MGPSSAIPIDNGLIWPQKTREVQNFYTDTRIWNDIKIRPDDIYVCSWGKTGTTWTQQIVSQLIFAGEEGHLIDEESPWIDMRVNPQETVLAKLEAQKHRRYIKTHSPIDAINYDRRARYIFVGRDVRDTIWSLHNHFFHATPAFYQLVNETSGRVGPPLQKPPSDQRKYFLEFLENDHNPSIHQPFWEFVRGWYDARQLPNLLFVHYSDLLADTENEILRIARFLETDVPVEAIPSILEHCSFNYMKAHSDWVSPAESEATFENGSKTFINKGTNMRWEGILTIEDNQRYEAKLSSELGRDCADWIQYGRHGKTK